MMPYIQGESASLPNSYAPYFDIIETVFLKKGDIGFLTIDESPVRRGAPHRGDKAKFGRALHTEVGIDPDRVYCWGGGGWWKRPHRVVLERDVRILLASNIDDTCAVWDAEHEDTSDDGDIGDKATLYPYDDATYLKAGDVYEIGIFNPHESLPVQLDCKRQFLRIVSSGVHGREEYFTRNPKVRFEE